MKILVFSINPIFPNLVTGGASKHLYNIVRNLGQQGHEVHILCAQAAQPSPDFLWVDNVLVSQKLPFHMPFPEPYAVSGADLGLIAERVAKHLESVDRFYIHDGEFLLPDVYEDIPTVISFRDNVYPESVLGTFVGKADDVICVSGYSADVVKTTAGRYYPGLNERVHQVNNGIDLDLFKPVQPDGLANELGVNPQVDTILLHPHRPEPGKGLKQTIHVVEQLVHKHGLVRIKVLVPEWIDTMVEGEESAFYTEMNRLIDELEVREHFVFIPWLSQNQMPALYSMAQATLCLGNFVEAFGNVAYESLACGTPSIVAKVGVHRTLLPENLIKKVNFGDTDGAVENVLAIINGDSGNRSAVLDYFKSNLDIDHQLSSYSEIILQARKREQLRFTVPQYSQEHPYTIAPWCDMDGDRIYHDFHQRYESDRELRQLLRDSPIISRSEVAARGLPGAVWDRWLEKTWIVPVQSDYWNHETIDEVGSQDFHFEYTGGKEVDAEVYR